MTEEIIAKINGKVSDSWNQGIYFQPQGLSHIKELVVYSRYETGGYTGGSCWGDEARPYTNSDIPPFEVLDLILEELCPNITYLQYKKLERLIQTSGDTECEYYGNSTDYEYRYIILKDLEKFIESIK